MVIFITVPTNRYCVGIVNHDNYQLPNHTWKYISPLYTNCGELAQEKYEAP